MGKESATPVLLVLIPRWVSEQSHHLSLSVTLSISASVRPVAIFLLVLDITERTLRLVVRLLTAMRLIRKRCVGTYHFWQDRASRMKRPRNEGRGAVTELLVLRCGVAAW